ncbi:MAG: hypothetical protein K9M02_16970 [Thiohalocapsa sp.]|nr:hypothetical protein [Thiohalocapsa sp.]
MHEVTHPALARSALRDGSEPFLGDAAGGLALADFWRWSGSSLTDNTMRGLVAEFLVARAMGADMQARVEWDTVDVTTPRGIKIEVKSASPWQSWGQKAKSQLSFRVPRTKHWDHEAGAYIGVKQRHADVYVFAVLQPENKSELNPLDLSQWTFYVLRKSVLDADRGDKKKISLAEVIGLQASETDNGYAGLRGAIEHQAALERRNRETTREAVAADEKAKPTPN